MRDGTDSLRVGLAGFGQSGRAVAEALVAGKVPGVALSVVSARDLEKARAHLDTFAPEVPVVPLAQLADHCDLVVEAATGAAIPEIVDAVTRKGRELICVSAGGFLAVPDLEELARCHGARVQIATGAMPGLDMLRSAAEGTIHRVHLKCRIKPGSLANEAYVLQQGLDFRNDPPREQVKVFEGTAADAARAFPRHLNVAVAISLAGIGFERTTIELWMDPDIPGAIHQLEIEGDEIGLSLESRNLPSSNPKTSRIVAPSILAALRGRLAPILVGS
ncbi:aspartate dehydrogenase domain-containing protein [Alloyangia pacifica]|uniref:Aspartate dehydrogenase n=1 Tax=Alloyangia pacifica TaxID=311180 RepID=A0A1I6UV76_9RHOB|nr:aspartate dehydrogenase domain-containing protein [Alloyangia pacifica]SDI54503.1 aspartate dehydrogenase [Alloyangia pacifica]SFT05313.1 aspartate dehydrogenase [Alloyangia pacifica]